MALPATGAAAPDIQLSTTDGQAFSLKDAKTPVVAAFFKVGCPTCQYTFPFLERIYRAYPKDRVKVVGISQDDAEQTAAFIKEFGVTFPVLLDDTKKYPASNAYQLVNVPSTFLIGKNGKVEMTTIGWVKDEFEQLNEALARAIPIPPAQIFKYGEEVKDFKAG
ncbi:MAG: TlpA disulfide reductase family protein [Terriglobales bacterium]